MKQRLIILDEVVPFMGCHATKANSSLGFILCNLYAQERCSIHAVKSLERAIFITNSNTHQLSHFLSLFCGGLNETLCCFDGDAGFLESGFCHRNVLSSCRLTTVS